MSSELTPLERIRTAHLFGPLHTELMALLRGLSSDDWQRSTAAGQWRVRDVAAHLLDVDLRKLSVRRDHHVLQPDRAIDDYADLVEWLNTLNAQWVEGARRLSPGVLIDLLTLTGPLVARLVNGLDPDDTAIFSVAWAGEARSANWMDTARDYTERWHHQEQVRNAVDAAPLTSRAWLHPVLDTSMRALPHAFRNVSAAPGRTLVFSIEGDAADQWTLLRKPDGWVLLHGAARNPDTHVRMDGDAAWRLLFNGLSTPDARARMRVTGDERLVEPLLQTRSVMV